MSSAIPHARSEAGFTLVELLVVALIIGILGAIALPAFLGRRIGAADASAKQMANTAEHAAIIYNLNNPNGYLGLAPSTLKSVEPTLNVTVNGQTVLAAAGPTATGYSVVVVSSVGDIFSLASSNGVLNRTCTVARGNGDTATNTGGGCNHGAW